MIQTSVAIIKTQKSVLLIKRKVSPLDLHSGQLAFPGGKVENNETTLQAAIRETQEEIGLDIHKTIDESPNYFAYFKNNKAYYIKAHIFEYNGPLNYKLSEKEVDKVLFIDDTHLNLDNLKFIKSKSSNLNVFSRFKNTQDFIQNKLLNDLLYFQVYYDRIVVSCFKNRIIIILWSELDDLQALNDEKLVIPSEGIV